MSPMPAAAAAWLESQGLGTVTSFRAAAGGCIHRSGVVETSAGNTFFIKLNARVPADLFQREAEGLAALKSAGALRVPEVMLVGEDFLLLENLAPQKHRPDYWQVLGAGLAKLHQQTHSAYGFEQDNYLGSTPQPNPWRADGWEFFGEQRLGYLAGLAQSKGELAGGDVRRVEKLAHKLPDIIPAQPASLIHGDLWSGNVYADQLGWPALIDPAAHYGWAEAELGMTVLFGGFPEMFYWAYEQARPLEPGWRGRLPVYNLYHLLNHLVLFGQSYAGQVRAILDQFV